MFIEYTIPDDRRPAILNTILKQDLKLSSRLIGYLKRNSGVCVNGLPCRIIDYVKPGDVLSVTWEDRTEPRMQPEDLGIGILFEDDWFMALNKPAGMPVHPSANHRDGTLANAVQFLFLERGIDAKIRPVNRLDRDTSGIALFAKHSHAQDQLIRQMKQKRVYKEYLGIVEGVFSPSRGTIDLPILRKPGSVMERIVDPSGENSVTHYESVQTYGPFSLVRFILETGRTHQIRVHCRAAGHPILGDWLYSGNPTELISRQALHSHKLGFTHPASGERITIRSPLPHDMVIALKALTP